jgi:hypothetical protein
MGYDIQLSYPRIVPQKSPLGLGNATLFSGGERENRLSYDARTMARLLSLMGRGGGTICRGTIFLPHFKKIVRLTTQSESQNRTPKLG